MDLTRNEKFVHFYNSNESLWKTFRPYVLKHNHRTGNRYEFAQTVNRVRIGQPTDEDMKTLSFDFQLLTGIDTKIFDINR